MPLGHWNAEWLNLNSQRRFPLAVDASCVDQSGSFAIPTDFLVALDFPINAGMNVSSGNFFIKNINSSVNGYTIVLGYQPEDGDAFNVASASIPAQSHTPYNEYALGGIGGFSDSVGTVAIGRLDNIAQQPPGWWTFSLEGSRIDVYGIRPQLRGVSGIRCSNGAQTSPLLQGIVELQAGSNIQLLPVIQDGQDPVIIISAINGAGTVDDCVCTGDAAPPSPILTINGNPATPNGDFSIVGSDCFQVTPIANGIQVSNTCAQPCCGPAELERITQDLERLGQEKATVTDFVNQLTAAVNTMTTNAATTTSCGS